MPDTDNLNLQLQINTLGHRLNAVEGALHSIFADHEGDTRDELKQRLDKLEAKLHQHFEAIRGSAVL